MSTMKLAGFNFTKISIEKKSSDYKDLKISSGINIDSIEEMKTEKLKSKESFLLIKWKYNVSYNPNVANLSFEGNVIITIEQKKAKEVLTKWKDKKLDEDFNVSILNVILKKCNIKALQYEDEFSLPVHFKLPSLKSKK